MLDAPRQDWELYRKLTMPYDIAWQRSLTPEQKFAIYQGLYRIAMSRTGPGDWAALDARQWQEKLARRMKEVEAYRKLDELRRERSAGSDAE
jgi:hypothetical protein